MNVLLIRPPDPMGHVQLLSHTRPMNLAYLAGYLRVHQMNVRILDYETTPFSGKSFVKTLKEFAPQLIGLSCMTPTIINGAKICDLAKLYSKDIITVVGGPHANGLPVETLKEFPSFDCLIFGEGEATLLELCQQAQKGINFTEIDGIVYRNNDRIVKNQARPLIEDLDNIPFPARDLIEYNSQVGHSARGFSNQVRSTEIFASRGCPYPCSFCAIQSTFGKTVRFRNASCVEEEINYLIDHYNFNHIVVGDDTFSLKKDRTYDLCDVFARTGIESWNCDTRVNTVSPELLKAMKDSGCRKVAFGVESGSQRIIDLIGKKITIDQVHNAVHWANETGIEHIEGNFIIGSHPSENMDDLNKTRELIHSLPWTFVSVSIVVPYPGTGVYSMMKEGGMLHDDISWEDYVMFGKLPKWHTEHFSPKDLVRLQKKITREFYLNTSYIFKRLTSIRSWTEAQYWFTSGTAYLKWQLTGRV